MIKVLTNIILKRKIAFHVRTCVTVVVASITCFNLFLRQSEKLHFILKLFCTRHDISIQKKKSIGCSVCAVSFDWMVLYMPVNTKAFKIYLLLSFDVEGIDLNHVLRFLARTFFYILFIGYLSKIMYDLNFILDTFSRDIQSN